MSFKEIIEKNEAMNYNINPHIQQEKNPFVTYQDMLDGHFVIEHSDNEEEDEVEGVEDEENEDEDPFLENDLDTISIIDALFRYCKKISNSHKKLKQEVRQLKEEVNVLQQRESYSL